VALLIFWLAREVNDGAKHRPADFTQQKLSVAHIGDESFSTVAADRN
jgi:hypothetical protein